jgi:hypothetical protein
MIYLLKFWTLAARSCSAYMQVQVQDAEPLTLELAVSAPVVAVASPSALR